MSEIEFLPPFAPTILASVFGALFVAWVVLRLRTGRPVRPARNPGLLVLRIAVLAILAAILCGPVRVDESPGDVQRPDLFLLLDSSQSMSLGKDDSRWASAWSAIGRAEDSTTDSELLANIRAFRFGHRLSAMDAAEASDPAAEAEVAPSDSDSRLAHALRQLSGRFGRNPPAGIVLFSDGRVRDSGDVERIARHYQERGVPVHVYPVGELGHRGDVAIVSVIAPESVRKYSDVEVQVFFRSFGYTGTRTQIDLVVPGVGDLPDETLTSLPVTLRGGAQSVTLRYRSDQRGRTFLARIPEQTDELSPANNQMEAEVAINPSKIRVLYVEGSDEPLQVKQNIFGQVSYLGPHSRINDALSADTSIECVSLVRVRTSERLLYPDGLRNNQRRSFPETVAELSAYDCLLLSHAGRDLLTEEQLEWIRDWVANRGGGLCAIGGEGGFSEGGWRDSILAEMIPIEMSDDETFSVEPCTLVPDEFAVGHSIWAISANREQNRKILDSIPPFGGLNTGWTPKPNTELLGSAKRGDGSFVPAVVSGNYGRGRTLAIAVPGSGGYSDDFATRWGTAGNSYSEKFWRNVVYWISENSSIARRRLLADVDKQFYRLGETVLLRATAFDETARPTTGYSIWGMIEPKSLDFDSETFDESSPIRWPNGIVRESEESSPYIFWGEEFELPPSPDGNGYRLPLELAERLRSGGSDEGLRIELTAYETTGETLGFSRGTQIDSTSIEVQILDDPFEQQNPFPNHDLLRRVASLSGGRVLSDYHELADVIRDVPVEVGPAHVTRVPLWNRWWLLGALLGLLTVEWSWRRSMGLA